MRKPVLGVSAVKKSFRFAYQLNKGITQDCRTGEVPEDALIEREKDMKLQVITLLARLESLGAAQLPVGVVVRDPQSGRWASDLVDREADGGWAGRLAVVGDVLDAETLARWQADANGVTWDLRIEDVEGESMEAVLHEAAADVLAAWAIMTNEL
jgi:hypothetical protein